MSSGRDKLAAMKQRGTPPKRNDKLAAMAARQAAVAPDNLEERLHQRDQVWKDLDHAETLVVQLLDVAADTATAMAQSEFYPPQRYAELLQEIHYTLSPHASHVRAFATIPSEPRRELAGAKLQLVKDFVELEKAEGNNQKQVAREML